MVYVYAYSDRGSVRQQNEDTALAFEFDFEGHRYHALFVCDGVGGGFNGKYSSSIVCKSILDGVSALHGLELLDGDVLKTIQHYFVECVKRANAEIYERYSSKGKLSGTTCSAVILEAGKRYRYFHVGDSRIYTYRKGLLMQITNDDSWVQRQIDSGKMTYEEAQKDKRRHTITEAVGVKEHLKIQLSDELVFNPHDDGLLITSDGYHDLLEPHDIEGILDGVYSLESVANNMMRLGQRDNLSAILVDLNK